jgi:hypothetical protein
MLQRLQLTQVLEVVALVKELQPTLVAVEVPAHTYVNL